MITIKTYDLKKAMQAARNIKTNTLLPIYSYVKLVCKGDVATFYKAGGYSFMVQSMDALFKKDITLLIDEKVLAAAVSFTQSKELVISVKGNDVLIDDGKKKLFCQKIEDTYPAIQEASGEDKVFIDTEVVDALSLAKTHASAPLDKDMRSWNTFVQLRSGKKKSYVAGANQITCYLKVIERELPDLSLDTDVVGIICKYSALNYFRSGNYDCFDTGDVLYGFIKTESKCPDLSVIFERFLTDTIYTLNRKEVISYCESVLQVNDTSVAPEVSISDKSDIEIELSFESISGNRSAKEPVDAKNKKGKVDAFHFQPQAMINSLSSLTGDEVNVGFTNHSYILSTADDKNTYTSVMGLQKL